MKRVVKRQVELIDKHELLVQVDRIDRMRVDKLLLNAFIKRINHVKPVKITDNKSVLIDRLELEFYLDRERFYYFEGKSALAKDKLRTIERLYQMLHSIPEVTKYYM